MYASHVYIIHFSSEMIHITSVHPVYINIYYLTNRTCLYPLRNTRAYFAETLLIYLDELWGRLMNACYCFNLFTLENHNTSIHIQMWILLFLNSPFYKSFELSLTILCSYVWDPSKVFARNQTEYWFVHSPKEYFCDISIFPSSVRMCVCLFPHEQCRCDDSM